MIIIHSNIIQKIIYKLGINGFPQQNIGDTEFDNLFIIRYKNKVPVLEQKKYVEASGSSATMMK